MSGARTSRVRLDQLIVERGLAESRSRAQALLLGGKVRVGAGDVARFDRKAGDLVDPETTLEVAAPEPYVSRGGHKLAAALDAFGIDPAGRVALDAGASTGGFTDVLLQRGAARVIALDVGYGQLHPRLRSDSRVTVLERVNARLLTELAFTPNLVVCDVSFISVTKALPPVLRLAAPGWTALVLVKPQFEAGRANVAKGVVRDPAVQRNAIAAVIDAARDWDAVVLGVVDSGLPGPKGNREFFVHFEHRPGEPHPHDPDRFVADAVG